ncbi:gamma-glutamyltransferase [Polymorphobacter fuscus]|uniref:Glutathione hydrolase proenzyme n=1 Tax=Sandarakinorhabdus fusca TaxID=1439888 RepID=A0A7C9GYY0_9SPHN|nr:gamma-glutamyltransferase [Polymorphobacter fuscus]KAB7644927.1 gamma-glutamyltransferase [Polymorphobacter fuscus]MQT18214.1 gamma-glutamyltransferase [Polymorphobacter fuscus]NJC09536.1 gamma-glutamyltranspeptidase/glutathione hydrolase [Polymorphobacter fuscus]
MRMILSRRALPFLVLAACAAPAAAIAPEPAPPGAFITGVSSADARGTAAGIAMLKQGGTAMDAIAATLLALSVVEPQSSGIGGGGLLVYQPARGGAALTFDGREKAPAAATPTLFIGPDGKKLSYSQAVPGGTSVGVPGNIAMLALAHGKLGKLPWEALFQPAITLARDGYEMTPRMARAVAASAKTLKLTPEAAALFLNADGTPKPVGTRIVNAPLAKTLEAIAKGGPQAFYTGDTAKAIVTRVTTAPNNPSAMTLADMGAYQAKARPPVCATYRRHKICTMGPPSAGGIAVLAILKQLEGFDLARLGPDSPVSWHLLAESQRLAFADRSAYGGDSDFVPVPVAGLVADDYLKARGGLISATATMPKVTAGTPRGAAPRTPAPGGEVPSTTHFAAVDPAGNVASLTSTVEGGFGSSLVAGGMVLNNELTDFSFEPMADGAPVANRVQGGKRPRSSMSPSIVYDPQGRPLLAIGAAGGMTIPAQVAKAIIGVIDWKLPVGDAIGLPLIYVNQDVVVVEAGPQGEKLVPMIPALKALGHNVVSFPLPLKANGLERVPGGWRGGVDPRSEGFAAGF